jgi:hypothetical protein
VRVLLKHFGSVAKLRGATVAEIAEVAGFGSVLAAAVAERLRETPDTGEDGTDPGADGGEGREEAPDTGEDADLAAEDQQVPAGLDGGVLETR